MKFGGTSLGDITRIKSAAMKIKSEISKGMSVVVVVSAMSGTTNKLIELVNDISKSFDPSEYDTVVSTGEMVSSGLLAIALQTIGLKGKSWAGWQVPIVTDQYFGKASINEIKIKKIQEIRKDFTNISVEDDYEGILKSLASVKNQVNEFFDNVIVNDEDELIKKNRLELLQMLCKTFDNYLNFSKVESLE